MIVVPGQELSIRAPLEATDLLGVSLHCGDVVVLHTHVVVPDGSGLASTGEDVAVPREGSNARVVSGHVADTLLLLGIPDLDSRVAGSNGKESTIINP